MEKSKCLDLLEKAIVASKSKDDCIKFKGFFKWRIVKGKQSHSRYDTLKMFHSPTHESPTQKGVFLINELDENDVFYAVHGSFVGTYRYKFKLTDTGKVQFLEQKLLYIR